MDEIMVSVAVLSYKHVKYIRKAIDSILEQKVNFKYEIVVGDDGSNDGTKGILEEYQRQYPDKFVLLIKEKNEGASKNSYNILLHCKGKYIASLESDDYWCDENKLQKQVEYLEAHSELGAVGSNYFFVDDDGNHPVAALLPHQTNRIYTMKDYILNGQIVHANTLLCRNIFPLTNERYLKVKFCAPTMGDMFVRALIYDYGGIFVFPEKMLCHRDGRKLATSFQATQVKDAMKYTYMMQTIIDNLDWYFNGKYDFSPRLSARLATLYLDHLRGSIDLDMQEYRSFVKALGWKGKCQIFIAFNRIGFRRLIRKLSNTFHKN